MREKQREQALVNKSPVETETQVPGGNQPASLSFLIRSRSSVPLERLVPAVCGGSQPDRSTRPVPAAAGGGNNRISIDEG